jgi:monoamine oxidase
VYKYTKKPVLLMFNIGASAKSFASKTDTDVLNSAMTAIKKMYPNAPNYVNYKRSNWGLDPNSYGSYPFVKAGATSSDCKAYSESDSTNSKIFFAGDGASCQLIGTVHGAYITGFQAANALSASKILALAYVSFLAISLVFYYI